MPRIFLVQLLLALAAGFALSITYTILQDDLASYLPGQSFIVLAVTIAFCLVIGLPIRMSDKVNSWWRNHQLIPIAGFILGTATMFRGAFISYHHVYPAGEGVSEVLIIPDTLVSGCGWTLAIFCLLHLYLPIPRRNLWARRVV